MNGHLIFGTTVLVFFAVPIFSQASINSKKDFVQIKQNIDQERKLIVESEIKKRGVLGTLYDINKNLNKINSEIDQLQTQLSLSKKTIEKQTAVVLVLEENREIQKAQLIERLRALYKIGANGYAQVLLSSHSSSDLARNIKFLKIITEKDALLLKNYKINIMQIASEQIKLKNHVRKYLVEQKILEKDKNKYDQEKDAQLYLLSKIEDDKKTHMNALKEWREAGTKLDEKLKGFGERNTASNDFLKNTFFEKQGHLRPPVMREIIQKYGMVINSKFETKIFHKGIFFAAHPGDNVNVLFDGKVIHAGWVNGFGETIIVDHGDHYYSLYAHNSKILKKEGDAVETGELIAKSGDSGSLRGPGLYFEIRHFSESLDPYLWFEGKLRARL